MKSIRLDLLLVERGLFTSREEARTAIMDGAIIINGEKKDKPGMPVSVDAQIEIKREYAAKKFASRGGLKLEKALDTFRINVENRVCLDIGASTGGFTDCLLKRGATKVYAVDVGYGQLAWHLRNDPRVVCLERINARNLNADVLYKSKPENQHSEALTAIPSLAVIDVSFISLDKILGPCASVLTPEDSEIICLVKPQFEVGRERVGKGGVVRSKADHCQTLEKIMRLSTEISYYPVDVTYSPVKGPAGNIEFLLHLSRQLPIEKRVAAIGVSELVDTAHEALSDV